MTDVRNPLRKNERLHALDALEGRLRTVGAEEIGAERSPRSQTKVQRAAAQVSSAFRAAKAMTSILPPLITSQTRIVLLHDVMSEDFAREAVRAFEEAKIPASAIASGFLSAYALECVDKTSHQKKRDASLLFVVLSSVEETRDNLYLVGGVNGRVRPEHLVLLTNDEVVQRSPLLADLARPPDVPRLVREVQAILRNTGATSD